MTTPASWGVQDSGFVRPTRAVIRAWVETLWASHLGANRNTAPDTTDGMLIDMLTEGFDLHVGLLEGSYNARYLSTVGGNSFDLWAEDRGFSRRPASRSTVVVTLTGAQGTSIAAGSRIAVEPTLEEWTLPEAEIPAGGSVQVTATAVNTGPVQAVADSSWRIVNPITGWTGVSNDANATSGRNQETIPEAKARLRESLRGGLLKSRLLALDGVTQVEIFENDTDEPDPVHNATHWVEALVVGGNDTEIANTIYSVVGSKGVTKVGNTSAVETLSGDEHTIHFSRPTPSNVYIEVEITGGEGFAPGDPASLEGTIAVALAMWGNAHHDPGEDVSPEEIRAQVLANVTGKVALAVRVDTATPAANTGILAIADRDVAVFGSSRITVTIV